MDSSQKPPEQLRFTDKRMGCLDAGETSLMEKVITEKEP